MPEKIYLSRESLEKTKNQLEELKTTKRRKIAERIQSAKDLGDLSENAEYAAAKNEQAFNEGKIIELENILKNVVLVEAKKQADKIDIGSEIIVKINEKNDQKYVIVGDNDTDPLQGKISYRSPLGQAFLGKRAGDGGQVRVPKGLMKFKIINIS
ncbi:MAG: transcription elongation factor GreA [Parcubacteria group bacterium Athens1014_10]|nr:MAG: transcription elongation factor GreA [Parcubacteria group bacterium Athens1014_10]TSD04655.1 MAG: transcription elongation factor GreA [Parcubacteria group bacterium Athens0714_12]